MRWFNNSMTQYAEFLKFCDDAATQSTPCETIMHPDTFSAYIAMGHCGLPFQQEGKTVKCQVCELVFYFEERVYA